MSPLRDDEKQFLLRIARKAIESAVTQGRALEISAPSGNLSANRGAFVTLRRRGRLRGCIGRISPIESLVEVVAECAVAAATDDPRFSPVDTAEISELQIELSVLTEAKLARAEEIQVGVHGLIVSREGKRGVLLPQVAAERHWSRDRFLEETCEKAGLEPSAWRSPDTRIEIFTAEIFPEADFTSPAPPNP